MDPIHLAAGAAVILIGAWFVLGDLPRKKRIARMSQLAFILVASVGVYSFVRAAQADHRYLSCQALCQLRPHYAGDNRRVPDFELPNMDGEMVRFSSFLGDGPVVLNFWTKTCKPCLQEMPELGALAEIVAERGAKVVSVTTDEGPEAVRGVLGDAFGKGGPPFPVLFDPEMKVVQDQFGTSMFPETWIIDSDGIIRVRVDGNPAQTLGHAWTDPLPLEVIEMVSRPGGCEVPFRNNRPQGPKAYLCGVDAPSQRRR